MKPSAFIISGTCPSCFKWFERPKKKDCFHTRVVKLCCKAVISSLSQRHIENMDKSGYCTTCIVNEANLRAGGD